MTAPSGLLRAFIVYTKDIHRRSGYKECLEGTNVNTILRQSEYMRGPRDLEGECRRKAVIDQFLQIAEENLRY